MAGRGMDWDKAAMRERCAPPARARGATDPQIVRIEREMDKNKTALNTWRTFSRRNGYELVGISFETAQAMLHWLIDNEGDSDKFPLMDPTE